MGGTTADCQLATGTLDAFVSGEKNWRRENDQELRKTGYVNDSIVPARHYRNGI
jgi:hypothetical protein